MAREPHEVGQWTRRDLLAGGLAAGAAAALPALGFSRAGAADAKRFALVITNQDYGAELGRLTNTHKDGDLVVEALRAANFTVPDEFIVRDADAARFDAAFKGFTRRLDDAGDDSVGCLYYSGHGASDGRQNYAIPVGSRIDSAADLEKNAVELRGMLKTLRATPSPIKFVFFDACRDVMKPTAMVSATKGLRPEGNEGDDGVGVVLMYATAQGRTAADNNLFAQTLAEEIKRMPGEKHPNLLWAVQNGVYLKSGKTQNPRQELGTTPYFYFQPPTGAPERKPEVRGPEAKRDTPTTEGPVWRVVARFEKGRLYFNNQARMYRQPSRVAPQIGIMSAGDEVQSDVIEYGDTGPDGFWYKYKNEFGRDTYVKASDALAVKE
jgi:hypothetical protein